jgi:hypothetical protein
VATQIQFRRGTAAEASDANETLPAGTPAFETDTRRLKIGDGVSAWNDLGYIDVDYVGGDPREMAASGLSDVVCADTGVGSGEPVSAQFGGTWEAVRGTWQRTGRGLSASLQDGRALLVTDTGVSLASVAATVTAGMGLVLAYLDDGNYLYAVWHAQAMSIVQVLDGAESEVASDAGTHVRRHHSTSRVQGWMDGRVSPAATRVRAADLSRNVWLGSGHDERFYTSSRQGVFAAGGGHVADVVVHRL